MDPNLEGIFGWQNPCLFQNTEMFTLFCWFMGIRAPEGGLPKFVKNSKSVKLKSLVTIEGWVILPVNGSR
jgi:hypothetical protein